MPGPRAPCRRPSRKMTARSYSRSTLNPLSSRIASSSTITRPGMITSLDSRAAHAQSEPLDRGHAHAFPGVNWLVAVGRPVLAVDEDRARRREPLARAAHFADHRLGAD